MKIIFKVFIFLLLIIFFSCGVKGSPKIPPSKNPEPVKDINIKQQGKRIILYWFYNPVYDDGKPIKEHFSFIIEENGKYLTNTKIKSIDNLHWIEKIINNFNNEICFRVIVKTERENYSVSKYKCIIPNKNILDPPEYLLKVNNEGILIKVKNLKSGKVINIYKGKKKSLIPPIVYKTIKKNTFLDNDVKMNNSYCYYLTYLEDDIESAPSEVKCILYEDKFSPKPPKDIDYVIYKGSLFLIWSESPSNDVIYYEVKKGKKLLGISTEYFFQINKWKKGDVFFIYAVDKAGNKSIPAYLRVE